MSCGEEKKHFHLIYDCYKTGCVLITLFYSRSTFRSEVTSVFKNPRGKIEKIASEIKNPFAKEIFRIYVSPCYAIT